MSVIVTDMRRVALVLAFAPLACGPQVPVDAGDTTGLSTTTSATTTTLEESDDDVVVDEGRDFPSADDTSGDQRCGRSDTEPCKLDVLVVVDNSAYMADAQIALTRALVQLVGRFQTHDGTVSRIVDVQMMFTTTDMGVPLCEQFQKVDYMPAMGAPITTGCNERINRFTGLGSNPEVRNDACTEACPVDVEPSDPFVAFVGDAEDNVPDGTAAEAIACLAPQGLDGCGYEQPLEAMLQAFDPSAPWNGGERPFLRADSVVLIIVATNETDCSMDDPTWMMDPTYWQSNPGSRMPEPTSAMCWNAGMACGQPDAEGVYSDCVTAETPLQPPSRYTSFLAANLADHDVAMIALTGVPPVTEVNPSAPYEPVAGGVEDLVLREWRDGAYPDGDLTPEDVKDGVDVEDKTFEYTAGPGCTEPVPDTSRFVQAIPNPRVNEVCQSLDIDTDFGSGVRCCIESVCDPAPELSCADGWFTVLEEL
jgi:hypothetical protein